MEPFRFCQGKGALVETVFYSVISTTIAPPPPPYPNPKLTLQPPRHRTKKTKEKSLQAQRQTYLNELRLSTIFGPRSAYVFTSGFRHLLYYWEMRKALYINYPVIAKVKGSFTQRDFLRSDYLVEILNESKALPKCSMGRTFLNIFFTLPSCKMILSF